MKPTNEHQNNNNDWGEESAQVKEKRKLIKKKIEKREDEREEKLNKNLSNQHVLFFAAPVVFACDTSSNKQDNQGIFQGRVKVSGLRFNV